MEKKYKVESQTKDADGNYTTIAENLTREQAMTRMRGMKNRENHKHWQDPWYVVKGQDEH